MKESSNLEFSGNIYIYQGFDIGEEINLEKVEMLRAINTLPLQLPKYFKNYHAPLAIELPHPNDSSRCTGIKMHNFGALSFTYQIPFKDTLSNLRKDFSSIYFESHEQSVIDAKSIYNRIKKFVTQPVFFQTRSSYIVIQVNPQHDLISLSEIKERFGGTITSMLRFETDSLSEYLKNEMLDDAIGYFRGQLIIVDTDAAFVYDDDYKDLLDFFEFANLQQLEMQFFDRLLDQKLNKIYEGEGRKLPLRAYLPFIGTMANDPIAGLSKLKVDISVITERLEGSIKLAGEPYYSQIYEELVEKLDLETWKNDIARKLSIITDVQSAYRHNIDVNREDILTVLIIILITIELVIGLLSYMKA